MEFGKRIIKRNKRQDGFKVFLPGRKNRKTLLRSSSICWKYSGMWGVVGFITADLYNMEIVWVFNLKLEQEIKNLACGDQWNLHAVSWVVRRSVVVEKISYWQKVSCVSSHYLGWLGTMQDYCDFMYLSLGDYNWEVHMRKKLATSKRRNSL